MIRKLKTISEFSEFEPKFNRKHIVKKYTLRNEIEDLEIYNYSQNLKEKLQNQNIFSIPFDLNNKINNSAIYVLSKKNRKDCDLYFLSHYLTTFENLKKLINSNKQINQKDFLFEISSEIKKEEKKQNEIIFRLGEKGDKFYLIFKGEVSILIKQKYSIKMSKYEYFSYLKYLKFIKEEEIYNLIITENSHIFNIDEINDVIEKNKKIKKLNKEKTIIYPKFNEYEIDNISAENYILRLNPIINNNNNNNREFFFDSEEIELKTVNIFKYIKVIDLKSGSTFGEIALSGDFKRTATIICNKQTILASLGKEIYDKSIKSNQEKLRKKNISLLYKYEIFKNISPEKFEKSLFNLFKSFSLNQNQFLIKKNDERKFIYFIKEGKIEIFSNFNYFELTNIIKNNNGIINEIEENKMLNKPFLKKILKKNYFYKIFSINNYDVIGLDDYVINNKYIFNILIKSKTCDFFYVEIDYFYNFIVKNNKILFCYNNYLKKRKNILNERLMFFRNNLLQKEINNIEINQKQFYDNLNNENNQNIQKKSNSLDNKNTFLNKNILFKNKNNINKLINSKSYQKKSFEIKKKIFLKDLNNISNNNTIENNNKENNNNYDSNIITYFDKKLFNLIKSPIKKQNEIKKNMIIPILNYNNNILNFTRNDSSQNKFLTSRSTTTFNKTFQINNNINTIKINTSINNINNNNNNKDNFINYIKKRNDNNNSENNEKKTISFIKKKNPIKLFNNNNSNKTIYLNSKEFKELELFAVNKEYERIKNKKK